MKLKLVGASLAELESALKYSGLFVDVSDDGDYAEIRAIPEFLLSDPSDLTKSNIVRCGCDAAKKLAEIKDKAGVKVRHLQEQVEEMGYKITELQISMDTPKQKPTGLEFWERLQSKYEQNRG